MSQDWKTENHHRVVEQQLSQINMTTQFMNSRQMLEQSLRTNSGGGIHLDTPAKVALFVGLITCILPIFGLMFTSWGAWFVGVPLIGLYVGLIWFAYNFKAKKIAKIRNDVEIKRKADEQKNEVEKQKIELRQLREEIRERDEAEGKMWNEFVLLAEEFRKLNQQSLHSVQHETLFLKAVVFVIKRRNHPLRVGLPIRESMTNALASEVGSLLWHLHRIAVVSALSEVAERFSKIEEFQNYYRSYLAALMRRLDVFGTIVNEGSSEPHTLLLNGKRKAG